MNFPSDISGFLTMLHHVCSGMQADVAPYENRYVPMQIRQIIETTVCDD